MAPPDEAQPLLGTTAPSSVTFRTTRTVEVPIVDWLPADDDRRLHVRLSLDEDGARVVFLGRVRRAAATSMRVSLPTATNQLYYEVYAEEGTIARGAWSVPGEDAR